MLKSLLTAGGQSSLSYHHAMLPRRQVSLSCPLPAQPNQLQVSIGPTHGRGDYGLPRPCWAGGEGDRPGNTTAAIALVIAFKISLCLLHVFPWGVLPQSPYDGSEGKEDRMGLAPVHPHSLASTWLSRNSGADHTKDGFEVASARPRRVPSPRWCFAGPNLGLLWV